jgi:RimJ/RimL family protein N-acetyltransferase
MRVTRVYNQELVTDMLRHPKLWEVMSEDTAVAPEEFSLDLADLFAIALLSGDNDDRLHGFIIGAYRTDTIVEAHVAIHPDLWGHKDNLALAKLGVAELIIKTGAHKLVASIPTTDTEVLRLAQRVGFKREGVNRKSFLRNGELLDQYYVGFTRD